MEFPKIMEHVDFRIDGTNYKGTVKEYETPPNSIYYALEERKLKRIIAPSSYILRIEVEGNIDYFEGRKSVEILGENLEFYYGAENALTEYTSREKPIL